MVCNKCGGIGHNSRTCISIDGSVHVPKTKKTKNKKSLSKKEKSIEISETDFSNLDLETDGFSEHYHDIVEISAKLISTNGIIIYSSFYSCCRPIGKVVFTAKIHGLTDEILKSKFLFDVVGKNLMQWIKQEMSSSSNGLGFSMYGCIQWQYI